MSRLKRKHREDIKFVSGKMGVNDLFDNMIKAACRINDEEYDYICENLTDDESLIFLKDDELSIKEKREFLRILESHLEKFYA